MSLRVATLNLERGEKCWEERRELIAQQLGELKPDVFALNEISVKLQTGRRLCFNRPAPNDPTLWPSDHVGVWADLEFEI